MIIVLTPLADIDDYFKEFKKWNMIKNEKYFF